MLSMGRARALVHQYTRNDKVYRRCLFLLEFREDFIRRGDKVSGLVDCQSDEMFVIVCAQVESVLERTVGTRKRIKKGRTSS
jgi:hypothetical protein